MNITSGRYTIDISNSDKVLFGKSNITKKDLILYYQAIAPIMLTHCYNRPISMQRFPDGINKEGFFQKNAADYFPSWIKSFAIPKETGEIVNYVVINKAATLIYLANQGCITPHLWLSRIDKIKKPDRLIFDLDPAPRVSFSEIQYIAQQLKNLLDQCNLPSFCMLTGSRGVHIVVPLKRIHTFEETRTFAYDIATILAQKFPQSATIIMQKNRRGTRIFIDWLRNGFGATTVAPYAVRAHEGAPIATPVTWHELLLPHTKSQKYTIKNILARIQKMGDPWKKIQEHAITLTKARTILNKIKEI